jgi:hypothetical protein
VNHELGLNINSKVSSIIALMLIIFISSLIFPNTQAQNNTSFSPADKFQIPSYNGTVSFAVNGSYSQAALYNDSWAFQSLSMNRSTTLNNFLVSAQNCNVTIFSYTASNTTQTLRLRYLVTGDGKQIFNFGQILGVQNSLDWYVVHTINGKSIFLTPGVDWTISPNGTVVVNAATGNFSVVHFNSGDTALLNSNLPFYEQHSVAITTSAVVAVVLVLAVVIIVRNKTYLAEKKSVNGASKIVKSSPLTDEERT